MSSTGAVQSGYVSTRTRLSCFASVSISASSAVSQPGHHAEPERHQAVSPVVRDLGVLVRHSAVNAPARLTYHRRVVFTTRLVTSLMLSRLDYCNAIVAGLPV